MITFFNVFSNLVHRSSPIDGGRQFFTLMPLWPFVNFSCLQSSDRYISFMSSAMVVSLLPSSVLSFKYPFSAGDQMSPVIVSIQSFFYVRSVGISWSQFPELSICPLLYSENYITSIRVSPQSQSIKNT